MDIYKPTDSRNRSSSTDYYRDASRGIDEGVNSQSPSSDTMILSEINDLSKTVTTLQSRVVELERKQETLRLFLLGEASSSAVITDTMTRENSHREARRKNDMTK